MRCKVIHYHETFFNPSETFIYNIVSSHEKCDPLLIAKDSLDLRKFPFPKKDAYCLHSSRFSGAWFLRRIKGIKNDNEYLAHIFAKRRPDLIHAHFGPSGTEMLDMKTRTRLPMLTAFYGRDISEYARSDHWVEKYKVLFRSCDVFLAEGPHLKSSLMKLGCPEEKIKILRIGISVNSIKFRPRLRKTNGSKVIIIFAGRFVEKKGLKIALEALQRVRRDFKDIEFRIIGDGPLREEIQDYIRREDLDFVRFLGFLDYQSYLNEMERADIFLHPSLTASNGDSEGGAPTTILEAQALGMPVISTNHADIPNVVLPGKSALLSKERDLDGLIANIIYALNNQDEWKDMGELGRQFVAKNHDMKNQALKLEEIYGSLLSKD